MPHVMHGDATDTRLGAACLETTVRFRGSNGVPARVVNTRPHRTQEAPAAAFAAAWSFSRIRKVVTQMLAHKTLDA